MHGVFQVDSGVVEQVELLVYQALEILYNGYCNAIDPAIIQELGRYLTEGL